MTTSPEPEFMELSAAARAEQEKHAEALRVMEIRRRQRSVAVPTKDEEIKAALRAFGHPICLFGEIALDRRERVKYLIAERQVDAELSGEAGSSGLGLGASSSSSSSLAGTSTTLAAKRPKVFHTEASRELIEARGIIARESWERARTRLARDTVEAETNGTHAPLTARFNLVASQVGDTRPLMSCAFTRDAGSTRVLTTSLGESVKVWDSRSGKLLKVLQGHQERVSDVVTHPVNSQLAASGSADCRVLMWNISSGGEGEEVGPVAVLAGHVHRLGRLAFDPSGRYLASASFDKTWRLFDVERAVSLLVQDGHSRPVYAAAVHPDGALVATGDLGGIARVWDVRNGKTIAVLSGHALGILCCDFSPDGTRLATGAHDCQVRTWDLRAKGGRCAEVLPAHVRSVSRLRYASSRLLCTAGHDRVVKLWETTRGGGATRHLETLMGHQGIVTGMDVASSSSPFTGVKDESRRIVTCGYDRSWKTYADS